jgi:exonuclease III
LKIILQNAQYLRNKTELFTAFLHSTTPDVLAISEHGLKENEISQCTLEGYTAASHFCMKKHKGGGMAIYSSRNITQYKPLQWITEKSIEKTFEVTGIELTCEKKKLQLLQYTDHQVV